MPEAFSIPNQELVVSRDESNVISWVGSFKGAKLTSAYPTGDNRCLLLLEVNADASARENLLSIERTGAIAWKAELPASHDSFIAFESKPDGLHAWTWNGWRLKLDSSTGRILERTFVK